MSGLSNEDRERLSLVTDVTHDDCYETTTPGTCALDEVVEAIVARHVAAALGNAADSIELGVMRGGPVAAENWDGFAIGVRRTREFAAAIVRDLIP